MTPLLADKFLSDPRIAEARRLVLEALADHQRQVTGVRPAYPSRRASYEQAIADLSRLRGGALYYPYIGGGFGRGPLVELADGSVKYDMITGIGVHYLGHSHPAAVGAAFDAALSDMTMQGNLLQGRETAAFARLLLDMANRGGAHLAHCFLSTSGAMTNENALKLVFHKRQPASRILAFEHTFAGRSLALAAITDKPQYRAGLPSALDVDYVPFFDAQNPAASTQRAVAALRQHLARYPGQHAAMWFELVLGEGGYWPGDPAFFLALIDLLREREIAVVIDEVQTFGRTTQPFAFQEFGLDAFADVVTVGKLTQVCATLFREEFAPPRGLVSQTFTAATSALHVGRAILEMMQSDGFFGPDGRIARLSSHLVQRLRAIAQRHPDWLRGPFGHGAMVAFTAFDGSSHKMQRVLQAMFEAGVIAFGAGADPSRVRMLMPIGAIKLADIDAVCTIVETTLARIASE